MEDPKDSFLNLQVHLQVYLHLLVMVTNLLQHMVLMKGSEISSVEFLPIELGNLVARLACCEEEVGPEAHGSINRW